MDMLLQHVMEQEAEISELLTLTKGQRVLRVTDPSQGQSSRA